MEKIKIDKEYIIYNYVIVFFKKKFKYIECIRESGKYWTVV